MSEFNEKRKNNSSGQFRRHHHSEGTDIKKILKSIDPAHFEPPHMTDCGSIQFTIPTNYTSRGKLSSRKIFPVQFLSSYLPSSKRKLSKPSDKAGAKYVFERIYSAALMEGRHSRGKKSKFNSELSRSPLIRRNGGLERILQKFPLNPHNIFFKPTSKR